MDTFPDQASAVDDPVRGQKDEVLAVGMALMGAWKDQARFDPVDLSLAADENTYSRFLIGPSRGKSPESNGFALACGALAGSPDTYARPIGITTTCLAGATANKFSAITFLFRSITSPSCRPSIRG
jgi:hypothetical protein